MNNVLQPGHHYQKFKFHQQQEALATQPDLLSSWPLLLLHPGWNFIKWVHGALCY